MVRVIVSLLSGIGIIMWAQSVIQYHPFAGNEVAAEVVKVPGDGYYWIGYTDAYGSQDILVIKYDNTGRILWSYAYDFGDDERAYGAAPVSGGGVLIAGEIRGLRDGLAMYVSSAGAVVFARQIAGVRTVLEDAVEHSNGSFYFVGKERVFGNDEVIVLRFNASGTLLGYVYYDDGGAGNVDWGYGIAELAGGNLVIVGFTDDAGDDDWLVFTINPTTLNIVNGPFYYRSPIDNDAALEVVENPATGDIYVGGFWRDAAGTPYPAFMSLRSNLALGIPSVAYFAIAGGGYVSGLYYDNAAGLLYWGGITDYFGDRDLVYGFISNSLGAPQGVVSIGRSGSSEDDGYLFYDVAAKEFIVGGVTNFGGANDPFITIFVDSPQVLRCGLRYPSTNIQYSPITAVNYPLNAQAGPSAVISLPAPVINTGPTGYGCYCPINADFTSTASPYACTGDQVDFTYIGDTLGVINWQWNFGAGAVPGSSTLRNPTGITYSTSGSKVVTLQVSDVACVTTVTKSITIHETPVVSFSASNMQPCEGEPVNFTNTGSTGAGWNFQWSFGADANPQTSTDENPSGVYWTSPGTKTVVLTISSQYCSNSASMNIVVLDKPRADFSHPVRACQGDTVEFKFTGEADPNATYTWYIEGGTPSSVVNDTIAATVFGPTGWRNVKLIVTNSNGCVDSVVYQVLVDSTPVVMFSSTAPVCAGDEVSFMNLGTSGAEWSYSWDFGEDATPRFSTQENPAGIRYDSGGTKTVTLEITNIYTGCSAVDTGSILIWSLPVAEAGPIDTTICFGTSVQIGSPGMPGNTYIWTPAENLDDPNRPDPVASPDAPITVYHLLVIDSNGCQNRDSITIYMLDPITVDAGPDVEICYGDTVQLSSTFDERYAYVWSPAYNISDSTSPDPYVWPDSTIIYTVTVIDTSVYACGTASDQVQVIVHPLPNVRVVPEVDTIARGESVQLVASGGVQYEWYPAYGLDNSGVYNPIASPDTTTVYYVRVVDVYGCVNWDSAIVYVREPEVWIPNAFSPNGDGLNDDIGVEGYGFVMYDFRVFDRYGGLVFYSNDPGIRWDGTRLGTGEPCPEGAYIYRFKGVLSDGRTVEMEGIINLIR